MKSLVLSAAKARRRELRERDGERHGREGAPPRRTGRAVARPDGRRRRLTVQVLRKRWIVRGHRGDKATVGVTVKDRAAPPCALRLQRAGTQRVGPSARSNTSSSRELTL